MGFVRMLATLVFIVALPLALITTNIRILFNTPLVYDYAFDRYDGEQKTGLSREDLDSTAAALRAYLNNGESTFFHNVTVDGLSTAVFNAKETRHMQDVKDVVVWVNRVQEVTAVYVLVYVVVFFIWARDGNVRQLAAQSLLGIGLGTLLVGAVAAFAAFGFGAAFDDFHRIVFSNSDWQLDPARDHLVQMFPEAFWRDMTIALGLMSAIEGILIAAAATVYLMGSRSDRRHLDTTLDMRSSKIQAA